MSAEPIETLPAQTGEHPDDLVRVRDLVKYFRVGRFGRRGGFVHAVDGVSFNIRAGETLGLVGESGCGKSTLGRLLVRLTEPTSGSITFDGQDLNALRGRELRSVRRQFQFIFQDPFGSLNPRMTVEEIVREPAVVAGEGTHVEHSKMVRHLLDIVGLAEFHAKRYPHELSGGQRQRVCIARALALVPKFIICDEPVSALDVSIQAQIINLMQDLQAEFNLTYLFISHDLSVVRHISDRAAVMYLGQIVELADKRQLFSDPLHPYTRALMSAVPSPEPGRKREQMHLSGDVASPIDPPEGCRFRGRCPYAIDICGQIDPPLREIRARHHVACHIVVASP